MKYSLIFTLAILFTVMLFSSSINAQTVGKGNSKGIKTNWVDANGDGICDKVGTSAQGSGRSGKGYGKKDGSGNPLKPQDGTGFGKKAGAGNGTAICDGTGPKGTMKGKGRK